MPGVELFNEASRQLTICNACRYCEGYCPTFRAIEIRRDFSNDDIFYLSNLCHDCRACYYACMYTPPHEFAINIPKLMSEIRVKSYMHWSWPRLLAGSFKNRIVTSLLACFAVALVVITAGLLIPLDRLFATHLGPGAFYKIVPYAAMVTPAVILFFYGIAVCLHGGMRSWSGDDSHAVNRPINLRSLIQAVRDASTLKHLGGGGPGCFFPEEAPSSARRLYHSFVFWGFLLDFVSTILAFIYQEFLNVMPPYSILSIPVICGIAGGIGLIVGTGGLVWFKTKSDRSLSTEGANSMDYGFLFILGLVGLTGMLTLMLRATAALGTILIVHLATVAALFITAPYGKFVHSVYRSLALIRYRVEEQEPTAPGDH